jgi:uncharacterized damage-inducible protein DinB
MNMIAKLVWDGLEFRKPAMLRIVEPLSEEQMGWCPPNQGNSISWQLWHIAEVEDNWVRALLHGQPKRYPFGRSVKIASPDQYPGKAELLKYFHEVREISRRRLEETTETDFERTVRDDHFGELTVGQVWSGIITSFAWHAGQIAQTNRLLGCA